MLYVKNEYKKEANMLITVTSKLIETDGNVFS